MDQSLLRSIRRLTIFGVLCGRPKRGVGEHRRRSIPCTAMATLTPLWTNLPLWTQNGFVAQPMWRVLIGDRRENECDLVGVRFPPSFPARSLLSSPIFAPLRRTHKVLARFERHLVATRYTSRPTHAGNRSSEAMRDAPHPRAVLPNPGVRGHLSTIGDAAYEWQRSGR